MSIQEWKLVVIDRESHLRIALASAIAFVALATVFDHPALAEVSEAKERFKKGVALFKDADYEGALVEFKAAYEAQPHYKVKYNIGTSLFKLHRYLEAKAELKEYLEEGGEDISGKDKLDVQGILYEVQSLIGSITVTCSAPGAHVMVNGEEAGPCPFVEPLEVDLGEYLVEVIAQGYLPFKKTVTVPGGKAIIVNAMLDAAAPAVTSWIAQGAEQPLAVAAQKPTKGYLSVETAPSSGPVQREVYVDGVLAGVTPLQFLEVEPGEHKIAVKAVGSTTSYYETVSVAAGQTVLVTAKLKPLGSQNAIIFGAAWAVAGGVAALACGVHYGKIPPDKTDDRFQYKVLTITFGAIAGIGLVVGAIGIALYTSFLKKDAKMKKEYLIAPKGKLSFSFSPFASLVHGGGVLGMTGTF